MKLVADSIVIGTDSLNAKIIVDDDAEDETLYFQLSALKSGTVRVKILEKNPRWEVYDIYIYIFTQHLQFFLIKTDLA
jgi:hypothetical protein